MNIKVDFSRSQEASVFLDQAFGKFYMDNVNAVVKAKKKGKVDVYQEIVIPRIEQLMVEVLKSKYANNPSYQERAEALKAKVIVDLITASKGQVL